MSHDLLPTSTVLDPVAMRIGNVIEKGAVVDGVSINSPSGWLVQGRLDGKLVIQDGTLWIADCGMASGEIEVHGDAYILGQVGDNAGDRQTVLICHGQLHLAATAVVFGVVRYKDLATYAGSRVSCRLEAM